MSVSPYYFPSFRPGTRGDPFSKWKVQNPESISPAPFFPTSASTSAAVFPQLTNDPAFGGLGGNFAPASCIPGHYTWRCPKNPFLASGDDTGLNPGVELFNFQGVGAILRKVPNPGYPAGPSAFLGPYFQHIRAPYNFGLGAVTADGGKVGVFLKVSGQCLIDHFPAPGENLSSLTGGGGYLSAVPPGDLSIKVSYNDGIAFSLSGDVICDFAHGGNILGSVYLVTYIGHILSSDIADLIPYAPNPLPGPTLMGPLNAPFVVLRNDENSFNGTYSVLPSIYYRGAGVVPLNGTLATVEAPFVPEWDADTFYPSGAFGEGGAIVSYAGSIWVTSAPGIAVVGVPPPDDPSSWFSFGTGQIGDPISRTDTVMELTSSDVWGMQRNDYLFGASHYRPYNWIHIMPPDLVVYHLGF